MHESQPLLRAEALSCRLGGRSVVDGLSLSVRRGQVIGLLGPNGAGKSTALALLTARRRPHRGALYLDGRPVWPAPGPARRRLGYLPHQPPLHPEMRVREYLRYCAALFGLSRAGRAAAVDATIDLCALQDAAGRLIGGLSQGYRQRVGIAQAIVHRPAVVVLDEPTVGLDPRQMVRMRELIAALRDGHAVVLSSHLLSEVQHCCDRVLILDHGRTVYDGSVGGEPEPWVTVALQRPPAPDRLAGVPGVAAVEALGEGRFRVRLAADDTNDLLLRAIADGGWGLREWQPPQPELERRFLAVTRGEAAA